MKKEIRTEQRLVTTEHTVYVASDGKEFDGYNAEKLCKEYERELETDEAEKKCRHLKLDKYEGICPLIADEDFPERDFWWYKLETEEDYSLVIDYYGAYIDIDWAHEPKSYPAVMCVAEASDYIDTYYLDDIIETTKAWFENFGKKVTIE